MSILSKLVSQAAPPSERSRLWECDIGDYASDPIINFWVDDEEIEAGEFSRFCMTDKGYFSPYVSRRFRVESMEVQLVDGTPSSRRIFRRIS